ncbi:unnamed protein product [marine sediment metagenome]|uniref:Uncharacterized protein n=1 Tax=marine sediment metagenome TaxID=412755 RepID=X1ATP8_9ZZZZ
MEANPIVWWELASHNAEKTADFLKKAKLPFENSSGSRICLFNEPSGVTLAMLEKKE